MGEGVSFCFILGIFLCTQGFLTHLVCFNRRLLLFVLMPDWPIVVGLFGCWVLLTGPREAESFLAVWKGGPSCPWDQPCLQGILFFSVGNDRYHSLGTGGAPYARRRPFLGSVYEQLGNASPSPPPPSFQITHIRLLPTQFQGYKLFNHLTGLLSLFSPYWKSSSSNTNVITCLLFPQNTHNSLRTVIPPWGWPKIVSDYLRHFPFLGCIPLRVYFPWLGYKVSWNSISLCRVCHSSIHR